MQGGTPDADDAAEAAFFADALEALPVCLRLCRCPDRWHIGWAGLKAVGAMRTGHGQRAFLRGLLEPLARPGMQVLVAGAADGASLDTVVHALGPCGAQARLALDDRCPAALELAQRRATQRGWVLRSRLAGIERPQPGAAWDLVFIHYTLSFLDGPARARLLARLQAETAPGAHVLLAVRDKAPEASPPTAAAVALQVEAWVADTGQRMDQRFAAHPALLAGLREALPAYAASRQHREATMARQPVLLAEFETAGFETLSAQANPGGVPTSSVGAAPGRITPWVSLLRRRAT